jgi:hypothetical protein
LAVLIPAFIAMIMGAIATPRRIRKVVRTEFNFILASARLKSDQDAKQSIDKAIASNTILP